MSRRVLLSLFGGLGALLIAILGYEIFAPHAEESETTAPAAAHGTAPAAAPPGAAASNAEISAWVATILARPLFSVTRKPDAGPAAATATTDEPSNDLPRLAGIFAVSNAKHAVFQPAGDVPPLVVGEGELVSGWRVEKIGLTSVTLNGPAGETTLEPKFDENMVPPQPQMPVVPKQPGPRGAPPPGQPGQPVQQPQPNARGAVAPNAGAPQRPVPGQPTAMPTRPPFIPQQRSAPQPGGVQQPPGVR